MISVIACLKWLRLVSLKLCFGDVINDALDNIGPLFDRNTLRVFNGVAFASYLLRVKPKRAVVWLSSVSERGFSLRLA